jgi:Holliday junction resolvase-like predicted endonuclease
MFSLPVTFPFKDRFEDFLRDYASCSTYWYVPKTRVLSDQNTRAIRSILAIIFDEFLGRVWNRESQDELLAKLVQKGILEPYTRDGTLTDRTALTRIWKKLLETLGLLWVQENKEMVITDAGLEVIIADNSRPVIEGQIAKLQYPAPTLTGDYRDDFKGLLPHLFLLQVLRECNYRINLAEYELFVNLAQSQEDVQRVVNYITYWRDLNSEEKDTVLKVTKDIPMESDPSYSRHRRINLSCRYQVSMYTYPTYLELQQDDGESFIICTAPSQVNTLLEAKLSNLKITPFTSIEDWFSYFGDPKQQPSWFTYLSVEVEKASTAQEAERLLQEHRERLTQDEVREIERKQVEKGIETFYVDNLGLLEKGLTLVEMGRQYSTPIGRIDLLCKSQKGEFVVVEIKAEEASDAVFGQLLRYIGWVHRNLEGGEHNVRGIILAGRFPEAARYSRIGLLKEDYQTFIRFKKHGLYTADT